MNNETEPVSSDESIPVAPVAPHSLRRHWISRGILSLVIFACGIVVGVGLTLEHIRSSMADGIQENIIPPDTTNADKPTAYVMKKFQERYTLSEEQSAEIEKIVRNYFVRMSVRRHKMFSDFRKEVDQFGQDVSRQLDANQKKDWEESYDKLKYSFFPRHSSRKHHHGRHSHKYKSKHHRHDKQSSEKTDKKQPEQKSENTGSESVPRGESSSVSE